MGMPHSSKPVSAEEEVGRNPLSALLARCVHDDRNKAAKRQNLDVGGVKENRSPPSPFTPLISKCRCPLGGTALPSNE
eukprot:6463411-Amphidinium_carterae.1